MGYDHVTITINAHLDRHGDDRQERDDTLWAELQEEIKTLTQSAKYKTLSLDVL